MYDPLINILSSTPTSKQTKTNISMAMKGKTYSKDWANEYAVVIAEGAPVTLGEGDGKLFCGVGLAALQGLEGEVKTTIM